MKFSRAATRIRMPLVISRAGRFYVSYWNPEKRQMERMSLDLPVDIKKLPESFADNPDWWRKSKYAKQIQDFLAQYELAEIRKAAGIPTIDVIPRAAGKMSVGALFKEFVREREIERDRPFSVRTVEHFDNAIKFLYRFKEDFSLYDVDRRTVIAFRKWGKTQLSDRSLQGYWTDYRALFGFAERMGYIEHNEFDDVTIAVEKKPVKQIDRKDEEELFAFAYLKNRPLFDQIWCERMQGFRVTEATKLLVENVDLRAGLFHYRQKGNRREVFPIAKTVLVNLKAMSMDDDPYLFHFRSRRTVAYYMHRACEFINISQITTHDLKRAYLQEIAPHCHTDRMLELLAHHAPTVAATAVEHYTGADIKNMRETLDVAQKDWLKKYELFQKQKDNGAAYHFSNPKGDAGRPDRWKAKK